MNITLCLTALHIVQSGTGLLPFAEDQPLPCVLSSLCMTTDPRVIANFLHECFAHMSVLLQIVVGVPQLLWLAFTSSYHCHSVNEHDQRQFD